MITGSLGYRAYAGKTAPSSEQEEVYKRFLGLIPEEGEDQPSTIDSGARKASEEPPAGEVPKEIKSKKKSLEKDEQGEKRYSADEVISVEVVAPDPPEQFPPPYRGSVIIYTNELAAIGLSESHELTYNPYYAMRLTFAPRYWFSKKYYARAYINITSEITQIDWDNDHHYWSDLDLGCGTNNLYVIPVIDTSVSGEVSLKLPTSESSRAATRVMSNKLTVGLSREFGKFALSLGTNVEKYWHRYTTGSATGKLIGSCGAGGAGDCIDRLIQSGVRNPDWSLSTGLNGTYTLTDWLNLSADVGVSLVFLYALTEEEQITVQVDNPQDTRYFLYTGLGATFSLSKTVSAVVGARSFHMQLATDGEYRTPFINRHTQLFLDVRVSVDGLVSWLKK